MDPNDMKLDDLLQKRAAPPMRSNLEQRILKESLIPAKRRQGSFVLSDWMNAFYQAFALPRPVLSLALVLLIGITLGTYIDSTSVMDDSSNLMMLYLDNDFNLEDL